MPRADGPFEALEGINDNAYRVDLRDDYGVSATFNVADLKAYHEDNYLADLRIKSSQQGEDDGVPITIDNEEGPTSPTRFNSNSKVQALTHIMEESLRQAPEFKDQFLPGFVHLIT